MTSPKFEPRVFCRNPMLFGRYDAISWFDISADDPRIDQFGASLIQHDIAYQILRAIKEEPALRSVKRYAESIGADPTRMGRMLRGSIVMRLEDMISARRHLSIETFYNVHSLDSLLRAQS